MQNYEKDKKRVNEVKKHLPNNPNPTQMHPPQTTLEPPQADPNHHQTDPQKPSNQLPTTISEHYKKNPQSQ